MINIKENIKSKIDNVLDNQGQLVIIAYSLLEKTEDYIRYVLSKALKNEKEEEEYFSPIFSCIKELTTNAIKANIKQILIDENTIKNPDDHDEVLNKIKAVLNEKDLLKYGIKCKEHRLSTRIYLKIDENKLKIKIINPIPLSQEQLNRMLGKIEKASEYDNLAQFYMENPDPMAEGMGLGLSMVVVLLKGVKLDYKDFKISTNHINKTTASLIIPFS